MTTYDYLSAIGSIGAVMDKNHISPKLSRYTQMYDDWLRLKGEGHKITWIIEYLAESYGISRNTFRNIVTKMEDNVEI